MIAVNILNILSFVNYNMCVAWFANKFKIVGNCVPEFAAARLNL